MVKINYDEHGDPQSVDMSYEEYCELLKNTQSEIKVQILGQISEFIHAMQSEAKSVDDLSISAASPQEVDEVHPESDAAQPIQKDSRYSNNAAGD